MKYKCHYCQQECQEDGDWQECLSCRVCYIRGETRGLHIKWEREIGNWACALNLYPEDNSTVLTAFREDYISSDDLNYESGHTEIRLNHCMKNVNQYNCVDKMKLLLMFQ